MQPIVRALWDSMLDSDMNVRYYKSLTRRYYKLDTMTKIIVAISSATSIAAWTIWNSTTWPHFSVVWQSYTMMSALLAVALPILNLQKTMQTMTSLASSFAALLNDYEMLWIRVAELKVNEVQREYERIKNKQMDLTSLESNVPRRVELLRESQKEVLRSRGLNK